MVSKGGEHLLLEYKEDYPGDHVANEDVLKALGISHDEEALQKLENQVEKEEKTECDDDACAIGPRPAKFNA